MIMQPAYVTPGYKNLTGADIRSNVDLKGFAVEGVGNSAGSTGRVRMNPA